MAVSVLRCTRSLSSSFFDNNLPHVTCPEHATLCPEDFCLFFHTAASLRAAPPAFNTTPRTSATDSQHLLEVWMIDATGPFLGALAALLMSFDSIQVALDQHRMYDESLGVLFVLSIRFVKRT